MQMKTNTNKTAWVKWIALAMVAVMLLTCFVACGSSDKPSGVYTEISYMSECKEVEFKGNKIIYRVRDENKEIVCSYEGTYEIKEDRIYIDIDEACELNGDFVFEFEAYELLGEPIEEVSIGKYNFFKD